MNGVRNIALVGCSDPLPRQEKEDVARLKEQLEAQGLSVSLSSLLLRETPASPEEKAAEMNRAFRDPSVDAVFDVSGGDLANTALPFLDFEAIGASRAMFYGFSDLTVIINAIIARTGRPAVNYQIRNLLYRDAAAQQAFFSEKLLTGNLSLADLQPRFLRGESLHGKVYGGNIRCFLKLAGTPYWPEPDGGVLLLESLGGNAYQMTTALEQYRQMGVFDRIDGILLGTFTKMREERLTPTIEELVLSMTPSRVAVAVTSYVGHYPDARAVLLGADLFCCSGKAG